MHELGDSGEGQPPEERPYDEAAREDARAEEPVRQGHLYVKLLLLAALIAYATAFVLRNNNQVEVDFVFATARLSLTWLILLSLALGLFAGLLLTELYRRRRRRH